MLFRTNDQIYFDDGTSAKVLSLIGGGGQGKVYKVSYNGKTYVVKMYHPRICALSNNKKFKKNLKINVDRGPVSDRHIWPLKLTKTYDDGSYGYLMNLIPGDYESFSKFITKIKMGNAPANYFFAGAALTACHIVFEYRKLWRKGLCFQDLNEGSIFINPKTWDVLICDCDNVAADNTEVFVQGMPGYMAPEVYVGKEKPNYFSDLHSLGVIIFMLLFGGTHPLYGKEARRLSFDDPKGCALKTYGTEAIYVMDKDNTKNRPQSGIDNLFITVFPFFPSFVRDLFQQMFVDGVKNPRARPSDKKILEMLGKIMNGMGKCPYCGNSVLLDVDNKKMEEACPWKKCGRTIKTPLLLENRYTRFFVNESNALYKWHVESSAPIDEKSFEILGKIELSDDGRYKIKNMTNTPWTLEFKGQTNQIGPSKSVKILYDKTYKLIICGQTFIVK